MAAPKTRKKAYWKLEQGRPKKSTEIILNVLQKGPGTFEELLTRTGLSRMIFNAELKELEDEGLIERELQTQKEMGRGRHHRVLIKLSAKADSPTERILRNMKSLIPPPQSLTMEEESKLRELLTDEVIEAMKEIYINYRAPPKWLEQRNPSLFKRIQQQMLIFRAIKPSPITSFIMSITIFDWEFDYFNRLDGPHRQNNFLKIANALPLLTIRKLMIEFTKLHQLSEPIFRKCDEIVIEFVSHLQFYLTVRSILLGESTGKKTEGGKKT
jgi:predicted transcriptional regulator